MDFQADIKPMFREKDRKSMLFAFDLWEQADVVENADDILEQLEAGEMPCDNPWTSDQIATFKSWIESGKP